MRDTLLSHNWVRSIPCRRPFAVRYSKISRNSEDVLKLRKTPIPPEFNNPQTHTMDADFLNFLEDPASAIFSDDIFWTGDIIEPSEQSTRQPSPLALADWSLSTEPKFGSDFMTPSQDAFECSMVPEQDEMTQMWNSPHFVSETPAHCLGYPRQAQLNPMMPLFAPHQYQQVPFGFIRPQPHQLQMQQSPLPPHHQPTFSQLLNKLNACCNSPSQQVISVPETPVLNPKLPTARFCLASRIQLPSSAHCQSPMSSCASSPASTPPSSPVPLRRKSLSPPIQRRTFKAKTAVSKVILGVGGTHAPIRQCLGMNVKSRRRCKNTALMEYDGPQPHHCAEHIHLDASACYHKCSFSSGRQVRFAFKLLNLLHSQ
jgi:hypothetical protein